MPTTSKGFAHLILIIGVIVIGIVGVGYLIMKDRISISPIPKVYRQTDTDYWQCEQDSDCLIAINPEGCCYCPDSINKNYLNKDNWQQYEEGKTYISNVECDLLCEQCTTPSEPVCLNNRCSFDNKLSPDTSEWKTYRNDELGFEVKLPIDIDVINQDAFSVELGTLPPTPEPYLVFTKNLSDYSDFNSTQTTINDIGFKRYDIKKDLTEHIVLQSKEAVFEIQWKPQFEDEYGIFDQILSTFRFIEYCSLEDMTCPEGFRCILEDALPGSGGICSNEVLEPEKSCLNNDGIWLKEYSECENVSKAQCKEMLGEYNDCASNLGCRHKDSGKPCLPTAGCISLCSF